MSVIAGMNRNPAMPSDTYIAKYEPQGIGAGIELLSAELQKGKNAKIAVYGDPDIDGLFAGLIAERYLDKIGYGPSHPNYRYFLNSNRKHGFFMSDEDLWKLEGYLLIAVDFSITPEEYLRILSHNINLIILDHHEIHKNNYPTNKDYVITRVRNSYGVILNNQYATEPLNMRFLSGAGMVYYFFSKVAEIYHVPIDTDSAAMVGITLLSDVREIENTNAYQFLKCTYYMKSDYMKYLQWIVTKTADSSQSFSAFGVPQMNRNFIDYNFSPIINSMLRADKGYDAMDLLRVKDAMILKYRSHDLIQTFRAKQKGIIEAIVEEAKKMEQEESGKSKRYSHLTVTCLPKGFVLPYNDLELTNYIGVACPKLKEEDKSGFICVADTRTGEIVRGSVRGGLDGVDYLQIFANNNVPCAGHKNAFGILSCNVNNIDFEKINEDIKEAEREYRLNHKNTRQVLQVNNLSMFSQNQQVRKLICLYNDFCRDNYRIYLRYTGNFDNVTRSAWTQKYGELNYDGIKVKLFDLSLNFKDCLIFPYYENKDYTTYVLRDTFEHDVEEENVNISDTLKHFLEEFNRTQNS